MNHQPMSKRLDGVSSTATAKANSAQAKADANEDDMDADEANASDQADVLHAEAE